MSKIKRNVVIGVLIIIIIALVTSYQNAGKYTLKETKSGLELWKGNFAPLGSHLVAKMDGVSAPEIVKDVYTKDEIFAIACKALLAKVDNLVKDENMPDFIKLKHDLDQALVFALSSDLRDAVLFRSNGIDFWVAMYKADMAISRGTSSELESAKEYLDAAASVTTLDYQKEILAMRKADLEKALVPVEEVGAEEKAEEETLTEPAEKIEAPEAEEAAAEVEEQEKLEAEEEEGTPEAAAESHEQAVVEEAPEAVSAQEPHAEEAPPAAHH